MTSRSMRVSAADYELAAARAAAEDRPIARIVGAAIRAYCDAAFEPPERLSEAFRAGVRDELDELGLRVHLQEKIDAIGKGVKVAAGEPLHPGRVPHGTTGSRPSAEPVSVGDHSETNGSPAACPPHRNERVLSWGTVCDDCGKKIR